MVYAAVVIEFKCFCQWSRVVEFKCFCQCSKVVEFKCFCQCSKVVEFKCFCQCSKVVEFKCFCQCSKVVEFKCFCQCSKVVEFKCFCQCSRHLCSLLSHAIDFLPTFFYLQDQLFPTFSMLHECFLRVVHDFCGQEMELTVKWGVGVGYS